MTRRAVILALLAAPGLASAHLPAGARGRNGGQVQNLGPFHGELVAKDDELVLFLFDHRDRPLDARRAQGHAVVAVGGQQQSLPFEARPDGSALVARGNFTIAADLHVIVQVVPAPGVALAQARFTPPR